MLPFSFQPQSGLPVYGQIVFAVKRAVAMGQLRPGDAFPSLRTLSKELRINPNTAQKVVTHLMHEGLLESTPGIGTVICKPTASTKSEHARFLKSRLDELVVEARHLGITDAQLESALKTALKHYPQPS